MAYTIYAPTKLSEEISRFKEYDGNIKVDYRDTSNITEPYLLTTPYSRLLTEVELGVVSPEVPSGEHITGDSTNYRRFTTDLMIFPTEYQTNTLLMLSPVAIFNVAYAESRLNIYEELDENEVVVSTTKVISHYFTINSSNEEYFSNILELFNITPLVISVEEDPTLGLIDTAKSLVLRRDSSTYTGTSYFETIFDEETSSNITRIVYEQITDISGLDNDLIPIEDVPEAIKNVKQFSASDVNNSSYNSDISFISYVAKEGLDFKVNGTSVLTDTLCNYYLYNNSIGYDKDIVGFTLNLNTDRGALVSLVVDSDSRAYNLGGDADLIGKTSLCYKPIDTEELSSPFLYVNAKLPTTPEEITIIVNNDTPVVLGTFGSEDFTAFCNALNIALFNYNLLCIECDNNVFILDSYSSEAVSLRLQSKSCLFSSKEKFTSFKIVTKSSETSYDSGYHLPNCSFTHIPDMLSEIHPILEYKTYISSTGARIPRYIGTSLRLNVLVENVIGSIKTLKVETELGVLETSIDIPVEGATVSSVINTVGDSLQTLLGADFIVTKNTLTAYLEVTNNKLTSSSFIKIYLEDWMTLDAYSGVYQTEADSSKRVVLLANPAAVIPEGP